MKNNTNRSGKNKKTNKNHPQNDEGQQKEVGHKKGHHAHMIKDFRRLFWISLALTVPVMVLAPLIQDFLGYSLTFPGDQYIQFGLSTIIYFYGGWPFLKGIYDELKEKSPGMMTLIALAITVAYAYSSAVVFFIPGKIFFWELVTLIDVMLLGHWIEMKSVMGASRALDQLARLMPSEASIIENGETRKIQIDELKEGNLILVKPGEKVPADGVIVEGKSHLNESLLTGESKPVAKGENDEVIGGSINQNGSLKIKVKHTGEDSYLNKVVNMVKEAQQTKSRTQNLADKAAAWLTYAALGAGTVTLIAWWLFVGKEFVFSLERMVTVMVISCPHALGLAIPLVVAISTAVSAQKGLLIRNRTAFENARKITTIIFDKTGTLTRGQFGVTRFKSIGDEYSNEEVLKFAGAPETHSEHPIGAGILKKLEELGIKIPEASDFENITGKGIQGKVNDKEIKVVAPGYLDEKGIDRPENIKPDETETLVYLLIDEKPVGFVALADEIRDESPEAVKILKEKDIKVKMATGDNEQVAKAVSEKLNLDGYYGEVLPEDKKDIIRKLQDEGEFVAMTGDGVNDAPALAQANVGIAVGSGTDVAAETADIVLVNSNPKDIASLILFGQATYDKMIQNLIYAAGYNIVAVPLAAGVLFPIGIILSPAVGAALMSLSTVVVAINAQLLKRKLD